MRPNIPSRRDLRRVLCISEVCCRGLVLVCLLIGLPMHGGCGKTEPAKPGADSQAADSTIAGGQPADSPNVDPAEALSRAVAARDWQRANQIAANAMLAHPDDPDVLTNAAIAKGSVGNELTASRLLVQAVRASGYDISARRIDHAIQASIQQGRLYEAIELLEEVLDEHPDADSYRRMLVGLLGEAQLTVDYPKHMSHLIRNRQFDLMLLMATTETTFRRFSSKSIDAMLASNPDDQRPRLGQAQQFLESRNAVGAEKVLREIVKKHPDFAPAHALLGHALVAQGKTKELPEWFKHLPEGTQKYAGYWLAFGESAQQSGQTRSAVRSFAEATRRSPDDSFAWAKLADAIATLKTKDRKTGDAQEWDLDQVAAAIAKRREALMELRQRFSAFVDGKQGSQSKAARVGEALFALGRNWEAEAWLAVAVTLPEEPASDLEDLRARVVAELKRDAAWQSLRGHPELSFDISGLPAPAIARRSPVQSDGPEGSATERALMLENVAERWGLNFYGAVGGGVNGPRVPIYQTLGCGGGVIDYDNDGKHDLVLVAAGGTIGRQDSEPGQLFRNLGQSFRGVGATAGFEDHRFSHGVAVGDFNDDGFADVLVLNLGQNRLLRNNGDGTFADVSQSVFDPSQNEWSTSGAIADVNLDGYADLVIVNYCDVNEPLDQPCYDSQGNEINCYPLRFRAAPDRFLRGNADGSFSDATGQWVSAINPGRGLGVVVGRFDGTHQGVYVANDASVNHYFRWSAETEFPLTELGVSSGLAVDAQSLDQGSMGIASADFDQDGDLDFYVTGFANEYNILYEQKASGMWADRSAASGLVEPTLSKVAFGTEAIGLDNDGREELVVANGHIGEFDSSASPYYQAFQVFDQQGNGQWRLVDTDAWGNYFRSPHVGRALFTLDADRDGRTDILTTHATQPVALLQNKTESKNHRIAFRLVDTRRSRDAVGAIVRFETTGGKAPQSRVLFRLAGDGYLCSNRCELFAGTGDADTVTRIMVTWPDGSIQSVGSLECDAEYLLIRDEPPFLLHRYSESGAR